MVKCCWPHAYYHKSFTIDKGSHFVAKLQSNNKIKLWISEFKMTRIFFHVKAPWFSPGRRWRILVRYFWAWGRISSSEIPGFLFRQAGILRRMYTNVVFYCLYFFHSDLEGQLSWFSPFAYRMSLHWPLIWFGYIARPSQWGGGGLFNYSNDFYLPSRCLEEGVGGQPPVCFRR